MIAYIKGTILSYTKDGAIVLSGDIGYELIGNYLSRKAIGDSVTAWTYHYLENENLPRLVACETIEGRGLLIQLMTVSGVGPKMAGRIVDTYPVNTLVTAIQSGDLSTLTSVKGLGKKTAQKIVLELGKVLVSSTSAQTPIFQALESLNFSPVEIEQAISRTKLEGMTENESIAAVLKTLGSKK